MDEKEFMRQIANELFSFDPETDLNHMRSDTPDFHDVQGAGVAFRVSERGNNKAAEKIVDFRHCKTISELAGAIKSFRETMLATLNTKDKQIEALVQTIKRAVEKIELIERHLGKQFGQRIIP